MQKDKAMSDTSNSRPWFWGVVTIGIVGTGGLGLAAMGALAPQPEIASPDNSSVSVNTTPIQWRSGEIEISGKGRVEAFESVALQAQISGDITFLSPSLQAGGFIEKGQKLISINADALNARKNELQAQLDSAQADLNLARTQVDRSRSLLELRAASQEEVDQRVAAVDAAVARVAQIEASLDSVGVDLRRSTILAPFTGRVRSENVSVGDVVAPGSSFAEVFSTGVFEIPIALTENDAALIDNLFEPQALSIHATVKATYGGAPFRWTGYVHRVEPGLDPTARTIDLIVRVDDPERPGEPVDQTDIDAPPLLIGMFASAFIPSRDLGDFVELPRESLRADNTVWYVSPDGEGAGIVEIAEARVLKSDGAIVYAKLDLPTGQDVDILGTIPSRVVPGTLVSVTSKDEVIGFGIDAASLADGPVQ